MPSSSHRRPVTSSRTSPVGASSRSTAAWCGPATFESRRVRREPGHVRGLGSVVAADTHRPRVCVGHGNARAVSMRERSTVEVDGRRMLLDGIEVLERARRPDGRVPGIVAHPDGATDETLAEDVLNHLCWTAGLALGADGDGVALAELVGPTPAQLLDANDVAGSILVSALLPRCLRPEDWPGLLNRGAAKSVPRRARADLRVQKLRSAPSGRSITRYSQRIAAEGRGFGERCSAATSRSPVRSTRSTFPTGSKESC